MPIITWTEGYSVSVEEMDEQHKKLIELINGFYDALQTDTGQEVISSLFNGVLDYTKTHFAREEELMKDHGFPEYEAHKVEHNELVEEVLDIHQKYTDGDTDTVGKLALLLSNWLMDHIVMKDKIYGAHLNSKGVT